MPGLHAALDLKNALEVGRDLDVHIEAGVAVTVVRDLEVLEERVLGQPPPPGDLQRVADDATQARVRRHVRTLPRRWAQAGKRDRRLAIDQKLERREEARVLEEKPLRPLRDLTGVVADQERRPRVQRRHVVLLLRAFATTAPMPETRVGSASAATV